MMQITAELSNLNRAQREAIANFILSYPETIVEQQEEDEELVQIPAFTVAPEEPSPTEAFTPAPPAPAGPVLVPSPPAAVPSVDKSGLPWDERIHASSRSFTADGYWRKKRGVSDGLVTEVETQLRSLMALPSPPASGATQPTQATVSSVPIPPAPIAQTTVPAPPAASAAPSVATVPTGDGKSAYVQLISKASAAIVAKQITQEQVNAAVNAAGVPSLPLLANRLDLVPQVAATIDTLIAANAVTA